MSKGSILIISSVVIVVIVGIILVRSSSPTMPQEKFVELYIKLSLAHEKYKYNPRKLEEEKQRILQESKVTMGDVDKFIKEYKKKPEKWVELWEKINRELERLKKEGSFTPP
jgi:DNA repair ATPase RecN